MDKTFRTTEISDLVNQFSEVDELDLCTVRADSIASSPLGNLYWVLVAKLAELNGVGKINVNDFFNGKKVDNRSTIQELTDIFDFEGLSIRYEEDVKQDESIFDSLKDFSSKYDESGLKQFKQVEEGFNLYQQGKDSKARKKLDRLVNELTIFLNGKDDERKAQILNHEKQTMWLIRNLENGVKKKFIRLNLDPIKNEYRGYVSDVGDLYKKILIGNNQEEKYNFFYKHVVGLLTDVLYEMSQRLDSPRKAEFIVDKLQTLDKKLIPVVGSLLHKKDTKLGQRVLLSEFDLCYSVLDELYKEQQSFKSRDLEFATTLNFQLYSTANNAFLLNGLISDSEIYDMRYKARVKMEVFHKGLVEKFGEQKLKEEFYTEVEEKDFWRDENRKKIQIPIYFDGLKRAKKNMDSSPVSWRFMELFPDHPENIGRVYAGGINERLLVYVPHVEIDQYHFEVISLLCEFGYCERKMEFNPSKALSKDTKKEIERLSLILEKRDELDGIIYVSEQELLPQDYLTPSMIKEKMPGIKIHELSFKDLWNCKGDYSPVLDSIRGLLSHK